MNHEGSNLGEGLLLRYLAPLPGTGRLHIIGAKLVLFHVLSGTPFLLKYGFSKVLYCLRYACLVPASNLLKSRDLLSCRCFAWKWEFPPMGQRRVFGAETGVLITVTY